MKRGAFEEVSRLAAAKRLTRRCITAAPLRFRGAASGGILFANSGKKYAKNAAKTKVLES